MAPRNREFGSMLWFSRSLSRFETQDIKTQPQINHNMNSLTFSSSSFSIYRSIIIRIWKNEIIFCITNEISFTIISLSSSDKFNLFLSSGRSFGDLDIGDLRNQFMDF